MIKFHGLQHPPPGVSHMFLLFFGNIHRDVRCPEGWKADPRKRDKTYHDDSRDCCMTKTDRKLSGLGGGLAYVGLSSKYDRNMSGSCKEISWICFFVTGICNWVQIFWGIKSKFEKKILLSSLQRWISQGSLANTQAQTHTRFQRIVPYQVSNHHD